MQAGELSEKYRQLKIDLAKDKHFTDLQKEYYLLGWLDCSLYVLKKEQNND